MLWVLGGLAFSVVGDQPGPGNIPAMFGVPEAGPGQRPGVDRAAGHSAGVRRLRQIADGGILPFRAGDGLAGLACNVDRFVKAKRPGEGGSEASQQTGAPGFGLGEEIEGHPQEAGGFVVGSRRLRVGRRHKRRLRSPLGAGQASGPVVLTGDLSGLGHRGGAADGLFQGFGHP